MIQRYFSNHRPGIGVVPIVIALVIFGALIAVAVSMNTGSQIAGVSATLANTAEYMAESGLRYAAASYLRTQNTGTNPGQYDKDKIADDEKTKALRDHLDNKTFNVQNNQSFHLDVYPYYFYADSDQSGSTITVQFPGQIPPDATFPTSGRVGVSSAENIIDTSDDFTSRTINTNDRTIDFSVAGGGGLDEVEEGNSLFIGIQSTTNQTVSGSGASLTLPTRGGTKFTPEFNGIISVDIDDDGVGDENEVFLYKRASFPPAGSTFTLQDIKELDGSDPNFSVTGGTSVVYFMRNIRLVSEGRAGDYTKKLDFFVPIHSSTKESDQHSVELTTASQLNDNFSPSDTVNDSAVRELLTASGGRATFSMIEGLDTTAGVACSGGNNYKHGNFWLQKLINNENMIGDAWADDGYKLNYDLQVKLATGKWLEYGGIGLSFRALPETGSEPDRYLGISFIKYNLARIYYSNGHPNAISPGDMIQGDGGVTGVVVGEPIITWDPSGGSGNNQQGILRLADVSGTFYDGSSGGRRNLQIDGNTVARTLRDGYTPAENDYIPDNIKPFLGDASHQDEFVSLGPLLMVLWERDGQCWDWLAVKDLTDDVFTRGAQDWDPPQGSCSGGSCHEYDGQIVNDEVSLAIRVEETRATVGGQTVKYNTIQAFYGDNSERYSTGPRSGNTIAYDRPSVNNIGNRKRYETNQSYFPIWPPSQLTNWTASIDYYSHLENPDPTGNGDQFQWDHINPDVSATVFELHDDGSILYSNLTTPDCTSPPCTYQAHEIGLHAFGVLDDSFSNYSTAGFVDFAIRLYGDGYQYGGFLSGYMQ